MNFDPNNFFIDFRQSHEWRAMLDNVEGTKWHREANTAVHTQMMFDWYMENLWADRNDRERLLSILALLMHDIGKPPTHRIVPDGDTGQTRNSFPGHEQESARMWLELAEDITHEYGHWNFVKLDPRDVTAIYHMIYHHVPFAYERPQLTTGLKWLFNHLDCERAFTDVIMSDQMGRISDTHQQNLDRVHVWFKRWWKFEPATNFRPTYPTVSLPHNTPNPNPNPTPTEE